MESPTFSHHDGDGYPTDQRESHWQPALRPDADTLNDTLDELRSTEDTIQSESQGPREPQGADTILSKAQNIAPAPRMPQKETSDDEDDGRLDPAWGIKRTDSAQLLENARRSPSFPTFLPQNEPVVASNTVAQETLEQSQDANLDDGLRHADIPQIPADERDVNVNENLVVGKVEVPESNEAGLERQDSRFEEGLPLISHLEQPTAAPESDQGRSQSNAFEMVDGGEEGAFFAQVETQPTEINPQTPLDRKSTSEVLDAMDFEKRGSTNENAENPFAGLQSAVSNGEETDFGKLLAEGDNAQNPDAKWAAVLDDDEFLIDDADDLLPDSEPGSPSSFTAALNEKPTELMSESRSNFSGAAANSYAPHQPSIADPTQLPLQQSGNVGFSRAGLNPMGSFQNHLQQQQPASVKAASFADQAKGGYKSPYDLPMDLSKPKKRPQGSRLVSQPQQGMPPPPPRSSSMSSQKQLQSPFTPTNPTFGSNTVVSPPTTGNRIPSASTPTGSARQPSATSFFEELPMTSKPRPPTTGRYTPSQNAVTSPPQLPPPSPPRGPSATHLPSSPQKSDPYTQFQLRPPERIDPYANVTMQPPSVPMPSTSGNRYSPAPGSVPGVPRPTASPRYSPAPPTQPPSGPGRYASQPVAAPATNAALAFQPRTSSPLAYQGKPTAEPAAASIPPSSLPPVNQVQQPVIDMLSPPRQLTPATIPPPQPATSTFSPPRPTNVLGTNPPPPQRAQTQSPSRQLPRSVVSLPPEHGSIRPSSAYEQASAMSLSQADLVTVPRSITRSRTVEQELDFEQPQDETQHDPLQRWKGAPIFNFGFGGMIVSSFPKRTPRYKSGSTKPQIKTTAGEVKSRSLKDLSILPERVTTFPGPLKGKSKKKDLLAWMTSTIANLETEAPAILGEAHVLPDPRKCHEEKILLWKVVKILIENDGVLENKPEALKALNIILSPEVHAIDESTASQYRSDLSLNGIYSPAGASARSDSVDPQAVEALRKHLLKGDREQAVWKAADSRLWSHALLLASTFRDPKLWRQVVQEFVRQEVKTIGNNSESLSVLYEIFGGNMEESIDQLVPPSARAGLQMVSKVDSAGPTKNALDGLDRWKETLSLVLNNRTPEDQRALATLGALLGSYGRVEAAHTCFLFARGPVIPNIFGGVDDPQTSITLLGSDQKARPFSFHQDYDALMLTEAYEFAITTLATTTASVPMPHLAAYKYERALELADNGFKVEAQAYCDAIASGITSKNKISPYFHTSLLLEVDELTRRLKQVPVQSGSWIAKPSVERATSSLLSKLSNFVAGDDSDADSKGSGADVGPFAKASGSPDLSRSGSQTDLYGSYPNASPAMPVTAASSRYAPGGLASARSSSELTRGRPSLDSQRSPPTTSHGHESRTSMYAASSAFNKYSQSPARSISSYQPLGTSPSRSNYQATPPQTSYMSNLAPSQQSSTPPEQKPESYVPFAPPSEQASYVPSPPAEADQHSLEQPVFGGYTPHMQSMPESSQTQPDEPIEAGEEQPQSYGYGYEPPADTGYVPYQPEPDSDDDSKKSKPKKKSFMDDDGDNFSRGPTQQNNSTQNDDDATAAARKKANDEAADAAFRAAAEADAQRAKENASQKKASGSWLGGWFGGKKGENSLDASPKSSGGDQKVYKAKLGENKMKLYYDKDLKKWVNPDDPDSMKSKAATPPPPPGRSPAPPMGGPPRSGGTPAPPMHVSRSSTPASMAGVEGTAPVHIAATLPPSTSAGLGLAPGTPPASGGAAPPRPVSNASSIDDLIGPATGGRKSAKGGRGQKKGRYVDVMAQ